MAGRKPPAGRVKFQRLDPDQLAYLRSPHGSDDTRVTGDEATEQKASRSLRPPDLRP